MPDRSLLALAAAFVALAPPARPQGQVWVVDDDGGAGIHFTDLNAAVTAAAHGDTILVRAGQYGSFWYSGKALTIVADIDANVRVAEMRIEDVPAGSTAVLRGLRTLHPQGVFDADGLFVWRGDGSLWVEDCLLRGSRCGFLEPSGLRVDELATSVVVRSELAGGFPVAPIQETHGGTGLRLRATVAVLHDSVLRGSAGARGSDPTPFHVPLAGAGLHVDDAHAIASGCTFAGGAGLPGQPNPIWGCVSGTGGGDAVVLESGSVAAFASTYQPGAAGAPYPPCGGGAAGKPWSVLAGAFTDLPGTARSVELTSPVREFREVGVTVKGAAGDWVWMGLWPDAPGPLVLPDWIGALVLPPHAQIVPLGQLPASGTMGFVQLMGALPPGIEAANLRAQTLHLAAEAPHFVLGAPSLVTLLDAAF